MRTNFKFKLCNLLKIDIFKSKLLTAYYNRLEVFSLGISSSSFLVFQQVCAGHPIWIDNANFM